MGMYYTAGVYYGTEYEHTSVKTGTVTKYNSDNGKPYKKAIRESVQVLSTDKSVRIPDVDETLWDNYFNELRHGADNGIFGVRLGKAVSRDESESLPIHEIRHAEFYLEEQLEKYFPENPEFVQKVMQKATLQIAMIGT